MTATSHPVTTTGGDLTIAFLNRTQAAPYYVAMTEEMKWNDGAEGVTVLTFSADDDSATTLKAQLQVNEH
ncbi:MAG: hypothetical protein OER95_09740 [Acidimicrobiia bacterium]|nr:hypothetical protein [Acidimicrobiia bacterium]